MPALRRSACHIAWLSLSSIVQGPSVPPIIYLQPHDAELCAGIGVVSTGHCHPKVVKAIQDQATQLIHSGQNIFTSNVAQVRALIYCTPLSERWPGLFHASKSLINTLLMPVIGTTGSIWGISSTASRLCNAHAAALHTGSKQCQSCREDIMC